MGQTSQGSDAQQPYGAIKAGCLRKWATIAAARLRRHMPFRPFVTRTGCVSSIFDLCLKVTPFENIAEAHAMVLVGQQTSIPVPQIHCAFMHKRRTYIVMSRVRGQPLVRAWHQMRPETKCKIFSQLRAYVEELRSIPCPTPGKVAAVDGRPIFDQRLPLRDDWRPFDTVKDFHKCLANNIDLSHPLESDPYGINELLDFYSNFHEKVVMTHGDLSSLNIMVEDDQVTGIIDWETAGWLPEYWEYTCAKNANPYNLFWAAEIDRFLHPFPIELHMEAIRRKYFGDF